MNANIVITRICLLDILLSLLLGCTFRPNIMSAHAYRDDDKEVISLGLNSLEASTIKSKQMYFSAVVVDCEGSRHRYPMEPYIAGQRVSEFRFPITSPIVIITGSMPVSIFDRYQRPCVLLEGGSYFFGKIMSAPISITKKGGAEQNKGSPFRRPGR